MFYVKKKIFYILAVAIIIVCGWKCKMILYGLELGAGQMRVLCRSRPIGKVLADDTFPDSLKQKLLLIQEVRRFAIDSLGINDSENYKTVYDQKGKPVLWVLMVCKPYRLKAYEWNYPILGSLGYRGYFDKEDAIEEAKIFREKGYDTDVGVVNAWSTLGWFKDPILSNMLTKDEGELARLIIHELTHGTLYLAGDADFSENLATFVGDHGAIAFLKYRYGIDSKEYRDYIGHLDDINAYASHIFRGVAQLDSLYASFDENATNAQKDKQKHRLIKKITCSADTITFYDKTPFKQLLDTGFLPNNTFFITYMMYRKEQNVFEAEFINKFHSDFRKYLGYLKKKYS